MPAPGAGMTSSAPSVAADATDEAVPEGIWARLSREFRAGMTVREVNQALFGYCERSGLNEEEGWVLGYELGLSLPEVVPPVAEEVSADAAVVAAFSAAVARTVAA